MNDFDQIMKLADEWYAHGQTSHSGIDEKYAALRAAIERVIRERDALAAAMPSEGADAAIGYAHMKERAERAEAWQEAAVIQCAKRDCAHRDRRIADLEDYAERAEREAAELRALLREAQNALLDYVERLEKQGGMMNYGRSVLARIDAKAPK